MANAYGAHRQVNSLVLTLTKQRVTWPKSYKTTMPADQNRSDLLQHWEACSHKRYQVRWIGQKVLLVQALGVSLRLYSTRMPEQTMSQEWVKKVEENASRQADHTHGVNVHVQKGSWILNITRH